MFNMDFIFLLLIGLLHIIGLLNQYSHTNLFTNT